MPSNKQACILFRDTLTTEHYHSVSVDHNRNSYNDSYTPAKIHETQVMYFTLFEVYEKWLLVSTPDFHHTEWEDRVRTSKRNSSWTHSVTKRKGFNRGTNKAQQYARRPLTPRRQI